MESACMIVELLTAAGLTLFSPANATLPTVEDASNEKSAVCLAKNMYYEARNQGTAGQLAVTAVVLNRVRDKRFPNNICEVIEQGPIRESWKQNGVFYPIKNKCQFSWYCDGKSDDPKDKISYQRFLTIAHAILYNELTFVDITDGAVFYHADYVTPGWAKSKRKTIEIQDHIFYTWKTRQ